jgi:uncharacterized membrane protein YidH (DUF202 family)
MAPQWLTDMVRWSCATARGGRALQPEGNDVMGLILTIIGVLLIILGVVQHYTLILGNSILHLSLYIAIAGGVLFVVGIFLWFRGRSAAA